MAKIDLVVPDIGNFDDVDVIEIPVKVGDIIELDQTLLTLESDKASMDVPAEKVGTIIEILVNVGDKVKEGDIYMRIEATDSKVAPIPAIEKTEKSSDSVSVPKLEDIPAPITTSVANTSIPSNESGELRVPDIGNFDEVDVIEVLVKEGDIVSIDQALVTLESDKASMDVPSDKAGTITELLVKVGDKLKEGDLIAKISLSGAVASTPKAETKTVVKVEEPAPIKANEFDLKAPHKGDELPNAPITPDAKIDFTVAHASPSVRAFARELGANLNDVKGTGRGARIVREDVVNFVKSSLSGKSAPRATTGNLGGGLDLLPWPKIDFAKFGEIEEKAQTRIQKISGANLARNWAMIPHVAQFDEADITDLESLRKTLNKEYEKEGARVTILAFLFKAVVKALQKYPEFNSSLDGDKLILKKYYHIGFAADTPNGLVVPVIRDCDKKGVLEIAAEMRDLAGLARDGKLKPDQMQGGTFTISSLGGIGGTNFIPIINAPEVAILGVSRNEIKPVWNGKEFAPRMMLPLSLSYDHRVIDGALGARFIVYLNQLLTDMRRAII